MALLQATEERNSAQVRIAAAEDTATQAFEEVGNMRDEVADLKERLTKVAYPCRSAPHAACMLLPVVPLIFCQWKWHRLRLEEHCSHQRS